MFHSPPARAGPLPSPTTHVHEAIAATSTEVYRMPEGAHDWFRPRLQALVAEAQQAGFARDVAVAVITDLINGPLSAPVPPGGDDDWNRDIGEPDSAVNGAPTQDPAGGPLYTEPVADPLQHVGHRFAGTRPK